MENDQVVITSKAMKVQIPSGPVAVPMSGGGLSRQGSITKQNCLCSPTTHVGSFRCRLHRTPSLQRTKSMESPASQDPPDQPKIAPSPDLPARTEALVNVQH